MYKIKFNKKLCIGCGACVHASNNWIMDGNKAKPIETSLKESGSNEDAKYSCPVGAIEIK